MIVSLGEVAKVAKRNGKFIATKENVLSIIQLVHLHNGHGGEKKIYKKVAEQYAKLINNIIPRSL
jgi:hypothetical protein